MTHSITASSSHTPTLTLTDAADARLALLASKQEKPGARLRITVEGGGCSGFQYQFHFPDYPGDQGLDDACLVSGNAGGALVVDAQSLSFMQSSVVDFEDTLASSGFVVQNPNATARCGCGISFSA